MGQQILILGLSGSLDETLAGRVAAELGKMNIGVRHAALFYDGDGQTRQAIGTPQDLQADLARLGVAPQVAWDGAVDLPEGALAELLELTKGNGGLLETLLTEFREFVAYEKADDAPKTRVPRKAAKKEGAAEAKENAPLNVPGAAEKHSTGDAGSGGQGAGVDPLGKVTFAEGTGSTAPGGTPVDAEGKPPVAGEVPAPEAAPPMGIEDTSGDGASPGAEG